MEYHKFLFGRFSNILNKYSNNIKMAFKTKNNSTQTIHNITKNLQLYLRSIIIIMVLITLFAASINFK